MTSISEAVFVSNLLRHIRQDRIDLDAQLRSTNTKTQRVGEIHATAAGRNCFNNQVECPGTRSLECTESRKCRTGEKQGEVSGSWNCFKKPRSAQGSPSPPGPSLPMTTEKSPAEQILAKELPQQPSSVPSSVTKEAVDKRLKKHQSQFHGKANAFKKHVAEVSSVLQSSEVTKQDLAETAVRDGLQKKHADRMSFTNLSTFIGACQFQAA